MAISTTAQLMTAVGRTQRFDISALAQDGSILAMMTLNATDANHARSMAAMEMHELDENQDFDRFSVSVAPAIRRH